MKYKKLVWIAAAVWMLAAGIAFSCAKRDTGIMVETLEDSKGADRIAIDAGQGATAEDSGAVNALGSDLTFDGQADAALLESLEPLIVVHVCGQVKNPGVYEAPKGSRLYELLELAGGFTGEAADDYLNLAAVAEDGQQIYVPGREEAATMPKQQAGEEGKSAKVNINTAGVEQLTALRGIGEAKAQDIINYRESHGVFKKIEEIMKISGIKEAAFEKIKDQITVTD